MTTHDPSDWLMLVLTLPGRKPALRMRLWRSLKTQGAVALRDGVYVLPGTPQRRASFESIQRDVTREKGSARLLEVRVPTDELVELFDRTEEFRQLDRRIVQAARRLKTRASGLQDVARLQRDFDSVVARDFFPGAAQPRTRHALEDLRARAERTGDLGEPHAVDHLIPRLDRTQYQGRVWVTRARPWVDRLASAWLIRRFIDRDASIRWRRPPVRQTRGSLGFDFDGATFTHQGAKVTFEVLMHSFSLEGDAGLQRLASIVHYLDVGGIPVAEAALLETILRSMHERIPDDDQLLVQASVLLDDLYRSHGVTTGYVR